MLLKNILYYIQGNIRYLFWYSPYFHKFIRLHIREQIEYRLTVMNQDCYNEGACIECGCTTIQLQMCNKPCSGDCYVGMMNKADWLASEERKLYEVGNKK